MSWSNAPWADQLPVGSSVRTSTSFSAAAALALALAVAIAIAIIAITPVLSAFSSPVPDIHSDSLVTVVDHQRKPLSNSASPGNNLRSARLVSPESPPLQRRPLLEPFLLTLDS
ncbi:hypothetical protein V8E51_000742 [Hyaloscypha variabilis]